MAKIGPESAMIAPVAGGGGGRMCGRMGGHRVGSRRQPSCRGLCTVAFDLNDSDSD